jgi:hypothetical protein
MKSRPFIYDNKYIVYSNGDIFNTKTNKYLHQSIDSKGYKYVSISGKTYGVHRVVALTFINNPNNLPFVNHKDENPSNNNINNLEWCTAKYNQNYHNYITGKITKEELNKYNSDIYNLNKTDKKTREEKLKQEKENKELKEILNDYYNSVFDDYYNYIDELYQEGKKNGIF